MIVETAWTTALYGKLSGIGFQGSYLEQFSGAIAQGSATAVIGRAFTTSDVGTVPGAGIGTGTGITGLNQSSMSSTMYQMAVMSFGQAGSRLKDLCDQVAAVCVEQLETATLSSVDAPVVIGVGTIVAGSITVDPSSWSSAISQAGLSNGLLGSSWPDLALALGSGQAIEVAKDGTGTLVIAGPTPGSPVPGVGAGEGTIS